MKIAKQFFFLFFGIAVCSSIYSQKLRTITLLGDKYARINDTLYAGIYEVSAWDYNVFLEHLSHDYDSALYKKCVYDPNGWYNIVDPKFVDSPLAFKMAHNYHHHPAFDKYPVVNIPWFGAVIYCEWLTRTYGELKGSFKRDFTFALPSEEEWQLIADADVSDFPKGFNSGKDKADKYQVNVRTVHCDSVTFNEDGAYFMINIKAYKPNRYGLYNVIGNVSELTSVKDIEKGGDYWTLLSDCAISKKQRIHTPDPRVGFRVIVKPTRK